MVCPRLHNSTHKHNDGNSCCVIYLINGHKIGLNCPRIARRPKAFKFNCHLTISTIQHTAMDLQFMYVSYTGIGVLQKCGLTHNNTEPHIVPEPHLSTKRLFSENSRC